MSIFISGLAFDRGFLDQAKFVVLVASILAGVAGYFTLRAALPRPSGSDFRNNHRADALMSDHEIYVVQIPRGLTMTDFLQSVLVWVAAIAVLLAGFPLSQRLRHEDQRPFAAYLIFTSMFILCAAVLSSAVAALSVLVFSPDVANGPIMAIGALALSIPPAFAAAAWLVKRPPRRRMPK